MNHNSSVMKQSVGEAAKYMVRGIKRGKTIRLFKPGLDFDERCHPNNVVGHLFENAFGSKKGDKCYKDFIQYFGEKSLPVSIISDLRYVNESKEITNKRGRYARLLKELAGWCLNEGPFNKNPEEYPACPVGEHHRHSVHWRDGYACSFCNAPGAM